MLAEQLDYVIGVDTHRDQHTLAVIAAPTGAVLAQTTVETHLGGYGEAVRFADRHALGARAWAVEGAGHYGAAFNREPTDVDGAAAGKQQLRA
jgi:transposase